MQPEMPQYPQTPQYPPHYVPQPYPSAYPAMPAPPAKQYPVPEGRRVPTIWAITLIALVGAASLLALLGGLLRPLAPAPYGTSVYASSLGQDDGAWQLTSDAANQCKFANNSLDATADVTDRSSTPSCTLNNHIVSDFHLRVRLLPPADANNTFLGVVYVRYSTTGGVAFVIGSTGLISVYIPENSGSVFSLTADQWHANSSTGNVLVIQAQGSTYTLAMNGTEVYSGDLNGYAENEASSGGIAMSALPSTSGNAEIRFADFALTTP